MTKSFQYENSQIFYRIQGVGKTVMLLHGFGEDRNIFKQQVAFLKNYCRLIVPDLPGSGLSDMLDDSANIIVNNQLSSIISINDYAICIHALLKHENIKSCIMLGHSMGGYITIAFAELFPQMLTGFGFIHSTAAADSDEKKQNRQRGIAIIEEYGAYAFLKNTIPNLFSKQFKETNAEEVESLIEAGQHFSKKALQQYYTAMMNRTDKTNVLQNNPLPVLFVLGSEDVAIPLNDVLQQTKLPLCSYIHVLQGVGHMSMLEATEQLNKQLLDFIQL